MMYAYLRISTLTHEQTTENQRKAILDENFAVDEWVVEDGVSGSIEALKRPAFADMMTKVKAGDQVVCTMVDRLGRTASDVLKTVEAFKAMGVRLRVLQLDGIDVTSSMGKLVLTVMAACAELEKNLLVERTRAGLARTKEQGTKLGQPLKIAPDTLEAILEDREKGVSLSGLSTKYGIHRTTIDQTAKRWRGKVGEYRSEFNVRQAQYEAKRVLVASKLPRSVLC